MSVQFPCAPEIRSRFPQLRTRAILVEGFIVKASPSAEIAQLVAIADDRLTAASEGAFPAIHPLIHLSNAASLVFAIPVAVLDMSKVTLMMTVRLAHGDEACETFAGEIQHPELGEVIFADDFGRAHGGRGTNPQSGWSAVRRETAQALIVCGALHETAENDTAALMPSLVGALAAICPVAAVTEREPL